MILLSIHPEYVAKIKVGLKRFEFRKRIPCKSIENDYVAIYCTSPVCKVVGYFKVGCVLVGSPSKIWTRTARHAGVSRKDFDMYFLGRTSAYALSIRQICWLRNPISIYRLRKSSVAPQSFIYLTDEQAKKILACSSCTEWGGV